MKYLAGVALAALPGLVLTAARTPVPPGACDLRD